MKSKYLTWLAAGLFAIATLPALSSAKTRSPSSHAAVSTPATQPNKLSSKKSKKHHRKHKKLATRHRKHKKLSKHPSTHRKLNKTRAAA